MVVEGGDGAGKGTLIRALEPVLRAGGHDVLVTQEPGGTPEGLALRALLLAEAGSVWDAHAELLLMAAARVQHVRRVIEPALAAGRVVLCDRYVGSTLAYQGGGRGIDAGFIRALHRETVGDLQPDLTLLLDVDPAIGLARSRARLGTIDEGRFEALTLAFHERVRATYRTLAAEMPGWVMLDASAEPAAITASARAVM